MNKIKIKLPKIKTIIMVLLISALNIVYVYAADAGVDIFDNLVEWLATWVGRVGLVTAFYGLVNVGFSMQSDDAHQKKVGINSFVAGVMVFAASVTYKTLLGL